MKRNLNSKVIATGLFNVADQNNDLDNVRVALKTLNHIVLDSGQFRALVQSKKIKGKLKVEILNSVLGKLSHPLVNEVVSYLKGTVASKMSDQQIESFKTSLDEILGKKTKLSIEVDPSLIGGIKLRIDNTFLDASIHNQLQTLRTELLQT